MSLIKSNDDGLQVEHINVKVKAKATDKKNKVLDEIVFKCGTYLFGSGRRNEQNNLCFPHPYTFARITSMNVTTGSGKQKPDNDGTNDDVEYKVRKFLFPPSFIIEFDELFLLEYIDVL